LAAVDVSALGRVLAVSPHLDDAVLSAGGLIAARPGSCVLTVFAGVPARYDGLTEWDAGCGFAVGDDVVAIRRQEDQRATARLGAETRWLDFVDTQYESTYPDPQEIAAAIRLQLQEVDADTLVLPLGLAHPDHQRTHDACAILLDNDFGLVEHWVAWADSPYRMRHADLLADRLESLQRRGFHLEPHGFTADGRKSAAVAEYPTQARGLGADSMADAARPEQFYAITSQ
jgi:LmbE family N-acetylglucosaminyl deacetylase